jgi:hypothetical protein
MEFKLSQESIDFLNHSSGKGTAWLSTKDGRIFLQTNIALTWLLTNHGIEWLSSPRGLDWLMEDQTKFDGHLSLSEGWKLLGLDNVRQWLTKTNKGKHWLVTGNGHNWLHTSDGHEWMCSPDGKAWLGLPEELVLIK